MSLLLMLNLACTPFRLTIAEVLLGPADRDRLAPGLRCDLALYRIRRPAELCNWIGGNPSFGRVVSAR